MHTETAPKRAIDFYIARLAGFVLVDGPNGKVLLPPGLNGSGLEFLRDATLMSYVPHFTGDWASGGPIIGEAQPGFLEDWMRRRVESLYGPEIVDPWTLG